MNKIQILMGAEGIKEVYEMSLKSKELDIVCLSAKYSDIVGDYFDKDYSPRLYQSNIKTREILPDTAKNREYAKQKDGKKNQVRFIKGERSESDMMLFEGKIILVSYNPTSPFAVVIGDRELVSSFKIQFDTIWKSLKC